MDIQNQHPSTLLKAGLITGISVCLGFLFDYFFYNGTYYGKPLGISFPIYIMLVLVGFFLLTGVLKKRMHVEVIGLMLPLIFFSSLVAIRASHILTFLNIIASVVILLLLFEVAFFYQLKNFSFKDYLHLLKIPLSWYRYLKSTLATFLLLLTRGNHEQKRNVLLGIGILLSLPALLYFLAFIVPLELPFRFTLFDPGIIRTVFATLVLIGAYSYTFRETNNEQLSNVLPTLQQRNQPTWFRGVSTMVLLCSIGLLSYGFMRLYEYEQASGFTNTSLYSHTVIIWIISICCFGLYTLYQRNKNFPFSLSAFISLLMVLAGMNILNPEAFIARKNIEQLQSTGTIDINRYKSLDRTPFITEDTIPAALQILDTPYETVKEDFVYEYYHDLLPIAAHVTYGLDWQETNLSRLQASTAINANEQRLTYYYDKKTAAVESQKARVIVTPTPAKQEGTISTITTTENDEIDLYVAPLPEVFTDTMPATLSWEVIINSLTGSVSTKKVESVSKNHYRVYLTFNQQTKKQYVTADTVQVPPLSVGKAEFEVILTDSSTKKVLVHKNFTFEVKSLREIDSRILYEQLLLDKQSLLSSVPQAELQSLMLDRLKNDPSDLYASLFLFLLLDKTETYQSMMNTLPSGSYDSIKRTSEKRDDLDTLFEKGSCAVVESSVVRSVGNYAEYSMINNADDDQRLPEKHFYLCNENNKTIVQSDLSEVFDTYSCPRIREINNNKIIMHDPNNCGMGDPTEWKELTVDITRRMARVEKERIYPGPLEKAFVAPFFLLAVVLSPIIGVHAFWVAFIIPFVVFAILIYLLIKITLRKFSQKQTSSRLSPRIINLFALVGSILFLLGFGFFFFMYGAPAIGTLICC